jgi:hypothetical protein
LASRRAGIGRFGVQHVLKMIDRAFGGAPFNAAAAKVAAER